jgi:transposase
VRRKFIEAEPRYPEPCRAVLDLIGELYAVEHEVPTLSAAAAAEMADELHALRGRLRQERSRKIVPDIQTWAVEQRTPPESSLGKAIGYVLGLWTGLTRFLDDPRIPLDNNRTERGLRGVVLGRKNHHGSRSRRGTEVAALFYVSRTGFTASLHRPGGVLRENSGGRFSSAVPSALSCPSVGHQK